MSTTELSNNKLTKRQSLRLLKKNVEPYLPYPKPLTTSYSNAINKCQIPFCPCQLKEIRNNIDKDIIDNAFHGFHNDQNDHLHHKKCQLFHR